MYIYIYIYETHVKAKVFADKADYKSLPFGDMIFEPVEYVFALPVTIVVIVINLVKGDDVTFDWLQSHARDNFSNAKNNVSERQGPEVLKADANVIRAHSHLPFVPPLEDMAEVYKKRVDCKNKQRG